MQFELGDELLVELRRLRVSQRLCRCATQVEVEEQFDAFLLDPGLGPMRYLTADGRVLVDERTWNGDSIRVEDSREAIRTIVVGAHKTGIAALLRLLPVAEQSASECSDCSGSGWRLWQDDEPVLICFTCDGLGWKP